MKNRLWILVSEKQALASGVYGTLYHLKESDRFSDCEILEVIERIANNVLGVDKALYDTFKTAYGDYYFVTEYNSDKYKLSEIYDMIIESNK